MRSFAHGLVDVAGVQLVHGHGTGCMLGVEVHRSGPPSNKTRVGLDWIGLDWVVLYRTGLYWTETDLA